MITVGLTGGYASGKSFVAAQLERLGCHLIYADRLGHQVLQPGGAAFASTLAAFGPAILDPQGRIDRKKLGAIVFSSPPLLDTLNAFVHPPVFDLEEQMLKDFAEHDPFGIAVIEAAILIETGRFARFDRLILTVCTEVTQIERAMKRDGLSREQVQERIGRQLPVTEKKKFAHYLIDTSGEKLSTIQQVESVFEQLQNLSGFIER